MKSETAKLPKGQSYPLKPSKLKEALASANVSIDVHLIRGPGKLFDAHFWPPNPNVRYERLYVRAGSVPATEAAACQSDIEERALPKLVEWITGTLTLCPKSHLRR